MRWGWKNNPRPPTSYIHTRSHRRRHFLLKLNPFAHLQSYYSLIFYHTYSDHVLLASLYLLQWFLFFQAPSSVVPRPSGTFFYFRLSVNVPLVFCTLVFHTACAHLPFLLPKCSLSRACVCECISPIESYTLFTTSPNIYFIFISKRLVLKMLSIMGRFIVLRSSCVIATPSRAPLFLLVNLMKYNLQHFVS